MLRRLTLAVLVLFSFSLVHANDPITVTEANGTTTAVSQNGLISFFDDLRNNPRSVTLTILNHPFNLKNVTTTVNGTTSIEFVSAELGIDKTFTGTSTGNTFDNMTNYLKSNDFLASFYKLLNTGDGATFSGTPNGTIGSTSYTNFSQVFSHDIETSEEHGRASTLNSFNLGAGLSKFDSDGFEGSDVKVSPGYSWKVGQYKDNSVNLSVPLEQITLSGLKTYRATTVIQWVHPFYLPGGVVWRIAPDLNYSFLGSLDIPSYTGTAGGGLTNAFEKDWGRWIADVGLYFGRYQNLGGIDTGLKANVFSEGLQLGRRLGARAVLAAYGIATTENVEGTTNKDYQIAGVDLAYRIWKHFKIDFSVNKTFGIPGYSNTQATMGSAWNF